jgi:hypothetical protein
VPHDVVKPKTGSKKKLVMQLDRIVQVCGIFLFVFYVLLALKLSSCFYFEGGHASFFMLFDWSTYIFSMLLEHILFFQ